MSATARWRMPSAPRTGLPSQWEKVGLVMASIVSAVYTVIDLSVPRSRLNRSDGVYVGQGLIGSFAPTRRGGPASLQRLVARSGLATSPDKRLSAGGASSGCERSPRALVGAGARSVPSRVRWRIGGRCRGCRRGSPSRSRSAGRHGPSGGCAWSVAALEVGDAPLAAGAVAGLALAGASGAGLVTAGEEQPGAVR